MANLDTPTGLKLIGDSRVIKRKVDASNSVAIFINHPVKEETDGNVAGMSAASDDYIGVVVGILDTDGKSVNTLAASTAGTVLVAYSPEAEFEIQFDSAGSEPTAAAIGDCADLVFTHSGSTDSGLSGVELSETLAGDGNSAQFRILELIDRQGNEWGHNASVRVVANEHALKKATVAV